MNQNYLKSVPEREATTLNNIPEGVIHIVPDLLYSKTATKELLKISETAYARYRKEGLPAHKVGMECYTLGQELIDFILAKEGNPNLYINKKKKK